MHCCKGLGGVRKIDQAVFDAAWGLGARYLSNGDELRRAWLDAKAAQARPTQVVACGVVNAGKSTLLNALADAAKGEGFAVAAVRETAKVARVACDGYELMDTPGLDALDDDDATAWNGIATSDLVLMVHNPRGGELGSEQLRLLEDLKRLGCANRVVLVLSHLEAVRDNMMALSATIGSQAQVTLGVKVSIFPVSSTNYLRGLREGKHTLAAMSGIPALRAHIKAQVAAREQEFIVERKARLATLRKIILDRVALAITERQAQIVEHDCQAREWRRSFARDMCRLWGNTRDMMDDYKVWLQA